MIYFTKTITSNRFSLSFLVNSDNKAVPSHPQESGCGGACKTVVIAVVSGFLCFTYAVILGYCTWRCYRQRHLKANGSKKYHPGVSMSAVHSDYVEEQNRLVPPNNPSDMTAPKSIEGHSEVSSTHAL